MSDRPVRDALVEAIIEADGGPDEDDRWQAEDMADDILAAPSGRDLEAEVGIGQRAAAALRLVVMTHHADSADVEACAVCGPAIRALRP